MTKILSRESFRRARDFIARKARPVDRTLFDYTFEKGAPEAVREALAIFANADGGFGHGIEPR